MILYYAAGGGLGHLTRARAVQHTLGLNATMTVLSASPLLGDERVSGTLETETIPYELSRNPDAYQEWLSAVFERVRPDTVFIDTFPAGLLGEWGRFSFPAGVRLVHVARLLDWSRYCRETNCNFPVFDETIVIEKLLDEHQLELHKISKKVRSLVLQDPPVSKALTLQARESLRSLTGDRSCWLIVHSEPEAEQLELIAYAREQRRAEGVEAVLVLIAPRKPDELADGVFWFDFYPAHVLFSQVERIFSGCGFNIMRQTARFRSKHRALPFSRRYDLQHVRRLECD